MTDPGKDAPEKGSFWIRREPERAVVAQSVAQYSNFVRIMKIALPVAAGILLIIVIGLPLIREQEDRFRIVPGSDKGGADKSLSMTNARYYGTDDKGQPYSLTAQSVRGGANDKVIQLNLPKAEITLNGGNAMSASANDGVYDRDKQEIQLKGDVSLYQYEGNELHTSSANITLKDGNAEGNEKVTGQGSFGTLEAQGFHYDKGSKVIHFKGATRLTMTGKAATKPDAAKEAPQAAPKETSK